MCTSIPVLKSLLFMSSNHFKIEQQTLGRNSLKAKQRKQYHALKTIPIVIKQSARDEALQLSLEL